MRLHRDDPDKKFRKGTGNCEFCGKPIGQDEKKIFLTIGYGDNQDESVLFACGKCEPRGTYDIPLSEFQKSPVWWMAHLTGKTWLTPTLALKFFKAMYRLRDKLEKEGELTGVRLKHLEEAKE